MSEEEPQYGEMETQEMRNTKHNEELLRRQKLLVEVFAAGTILQGVSTAIDVYNDKPLQAVFFGLSTAALATATGLSEVARRKFKEANRIVKK